MTGYFVHKIAVQMTGDRAWIHSTRREGVVPTWVTFRNIPPKIPDSVLRKYTLLFGKQLKKEYLIRVEHDGQQEFFNCRLSPDDGRME